MTYPILATRITATTLVMVRDRTRHVAELFGLGKLESTRFITAVSEIARNAVQFAGDGTVTFSFREGGDSHAPAALIAVISDKGPGIQDIEAVLEGRGSSKGTPPLGIVGSKRLVDALAIESAKDAGTIVTIQMFLPRNTPRFTLGELGKLVDELAHRKPQTPLEELEKQNREMLDTLQELREKQQELQRADERKNQFLAMLAHELRNPLGTLHMNVEILRHSPDIQPEELGRRREVMARQIEQMTRLVEDMIDVARVSQGKIDLHKVPVEINELVAQVIETAGAAIASKQHQVIINSHAEPVWVHADVLRLKQALGNLIQNAARYTPPSGRIVVSISCKDPYAQIEIADNGIGIASDMLSHVFDMFVQGEANGVESKGGLGIGLTLVHRLIEAHGGKVSVCSEGIGKGCQFLVCLPLQ